jgi:hypothetical protein
MLTRREVEGELRSLGFRASARARRAERERALRFVRAVVGAMFGLALVALLGAVNLIETHPSDLASHRSHGSSSSSEWVRGNGGSQPARATSLFFTGRRTMHPDDPRGRSRDRRRSD